MRSRWSAHAGFWSAAAAFAVVAASASSFPGLSLATRATGRRPANAVPASALRGASGSDLRFVERNGNFYVVDPLTGERSTFGNDLMAVGATTLGDGRTVTVAWSKGAAFAIDTRRGLVQPLDPDTLQPTGKAARIGRQLSNGVVDADQTLWVASSESGYVYGLTGKTALKVVDKGKVAAGGQKLLMSLDGSGTPMVTNSVTGQVVPAATKARQAASAASKATGGAGELASGPSGAAGRGITGVVVPGGDGSSVTVPAVPPTVDTTVPPPVTSPPPTAAPPTTDTIPPPPPPPPPPPTTTPPPPPTPLPDTPTGLAVDVRPSGLVTVSWDPAANADSYRVRWTDGDTADDRDVSDRTATTLDTLTPGTTYSITVAAVNPTGTVWSDAVTATPYVAKAATIGTPHRQPTGGGAVSPHVWVVPVTVAAGSSGPATVTITSDTSNTVQYDVPDEGGTFDYEVSLDWDASATVSAEVCVGARCVSNPTTVSLTNSRPELADGAPELAVLGDDVSASSTSAVALITIDTQGSSEFAPGLVAEAKWRLLPEDDPSSPLSWQVVPLPGDAALNATSADVVVDPSHRYYVEFAYRLVDSDVWVTGRSSAVDVLPTPGS